MALDGILGSSDIALIVNQFLYGSHNTPSNLVNDSLIRADSVTTSEIINIPNFMSTGAGRFALGAQFDFVNDFFEGSDSLASGAYSKQYIAESIPAD